MRLSAVSAISWIFGVCDLRGRSSCQHRHPKTSGRARPGTSFSQFPYDSLFCDLSRFSSLRCPSVRLPLQILASAGPVHLVTVSFFCRDWRGKGEGDTNHFHYWSYPTRLFLFFVRCCSAVEVHAGVLVHHHFFVAGLGHRPTRTGKEALQVGSDGGK